MLYESLRTPVPPRLTDSQLARLRGGLICAHLVLTMILTLSVATQSNSIEYREGEGYATSSRIFGWPAVVIMWAFIACELLSAVRSDIRIKGATIVLLWMQVGCFIGSFAGLEGGRHYFPSEMPNYRNILLLRVDRTTVPYFSLMLVSLALSVCYRRVPIRFNSQQLLWFVAITAVILGIFQNLWLGGLAPTAR